MKNIIYICLGMLVMAGVLLAGLFIRKDQSEVIDLDTDEIVQIKYEYTKNSTDARINPNTEVILYGVSEGVYHLIGAVQVVWLGEDILIIDMPKSIYDRYNGSNISFQYIMFYKGNNTEVCARLEYILSNGSVI